jgi:tetratricopeptide (TPR) repeat protein
MSLPAGVRELAAAERLRRAASAARAMSPVAPLGAFLVAIWIVLGWTNGGYPATRWGPIGLALCVAFAVALALVPVGVVRAGPARVAAVTCLTAYLVFSYASILWADQPGDAWTGADRGLLAVVSFLAFALWPWSLTGVRSILAAFVLAVSASAAVELLRVVAVSDSSGFFNDGRLIGPIGYENGTVAFWMIAFWPAVHLASTEAAPRWLRPAAMAGATLLLEISVLGQSRAWPVALIVCAAVFVLVARQRMRWIAGLALSAALAAIALPFLLDVFEKRGTSGFDAAIDRAVLVSFATAVVAAAVTALWVRAEDRVRLSARRHRQLGLATAGVVTILVAAAIGAGLAKVGDPVDWGRAKWNDFAHSFSFAQETSRFGGTLSGQRYEEWRVAWDQFLDHPVLGAGPDNFAAAYLAGRDDNFHEPRHPHSLPLRFLSQAGILGTLLFAGGLGCAVYVIIRRRRRLDAVDGGSVAVVLVVGTYWLVHGAVDVLWEIPAVSAPVLGLLGLAASRRPSGRPGRRARSATAVAVTGGAIVALAGLSTMLVLPWFSSLYTTAGSRVWARDPQLAYDRLETAASLAPLSADPLVVEGSIALRRGDLDRAREAFARAIERDPKAWYAYLELGLLEGSVGRYDEARRYLAESLRLNPNDRVTRLANVLVRERKRIDPASLNRVFVDPNSTPPGLESYTHDAGPPP